MLSGFSHLATIDAQSNADRLYLKGHWVIQQVAALEKFTKNITEHKESIKTIDASQIESMDTAGAFFLKNLLEKLKAELPDVTLTGLSEKYDSLFHLVSDEVEAIEKKPVTIKKYPWLYRLGQWAVSVTHQAIDYFAFLGELTIHIMTSLLNPLKIQVRSVINEIDLAGYRALMIIAVMMFLIGVVLAYQMGVELRVYGANMYVVDVSGVAIFREFSPLITSVIIAGRTSTAYAALLGTMKVNEEIDALKTMGLSPIDRLVIPKILGLLISLPLLVVWGDIFGILGSMVMSKNVLDMGYSAFLQRLQQVVAVKHLYLGLIKTPIFALIIAGVGCFQGFQAEGSAQSVGVRTTKAAVQAIFLIIVADALFSILFNWMDL